MQALLVDAAASKVPERAAFYGAGLRCCEHVLPTMLRMMQADVLVRGAGVVGQSLALALARQGLKVALVGAPSNPTRPDVRAYALNVASRALLQTLKVWDTLPPARVTPVLEMQVRGDARGACLTFSAWQQTVEALAWIVDVPALEQALQTAVRYAQHVTVVQEADLPVQAPLVALCEGKTSSNRDQLGVRVERFSYGQQAIAARLVAELPHNGVAHQWFVGSEVLALLPVDAPRAGSTVALVWSVPEQRASDLLALPDADFEAALTQASHGALGALQLTSARQAWPLFRSQAQTWSGDGWVLLGDAAHGIHPLAGQGLNLGLADVACLAQVLGERETWRGLGDAKLLRRYDRARVLPTWAMDQGVDGLWQLFAAPNPMVREARNLGFNALEKLPVLKRWLTSHALGV